MTLTPLRAPYRSFLSRTAVALAAAAACVGAQAAPAFTFDPGAAGLAGSSFTADTISISDYSTVTFDGVGGFTDTGYLPVSGFQNQSGGTIVSPVGLNSTYGLYFAFSGEGNTSPGNPSTTPTSGAFTSLTYQLYGYNGAPASYSVAGNTPSKSATTDVLLASGELKSGTAGTIPASPSFTPTASLQLTFNPAPGAAGFFSSPSSFYDLAFAAFTNLPTQVTPFANGFSIAAGGGSVNFATAVPEPETYAMLLAGLGVIGFLGRRRRTTES